MTDDHLPPGLLISVRTALEAEAAIAGGATLIDIKEPANGSLGKADDHVIAVIVSAVNARLPLSSALGELIDLPLGNVLLPRGLQFFKWGLAKCRHGFPWRERLDQIRRQAAPAEVVFVAYADAECAQAPSVDEVFQFAARNAPATLLLDTHCKTPLNRYTKKPTLLDWLSVSYLATLRQKCRASNVRIALAGSLGMPEIVALRGLRPDWFAVRGAACRDGDREAEVDAEKVRAIKECIVGRFTV